MTVTSLLALLGGFVFGGVVVIGYRLARIEAALRDVVGAINYGARTRG